MRFDEGSSNAEQCFLFPSLSAAEGELLGLVGIPGFYAVMGWRANVGEINCEQKEHSVKGGFR